MELSSTGIHQQPAPFFSKSKDAVLVGLTVIATLFIIAVSQWLSFTPMPASTVAEPTYDFTAAAYFWSFIISVQVIVVSVLYRPHLQPPYSHTN